MVSLARNLANTIKEISTISLELSAQTVKSRDMRSYQFKSLGSEQGIHYSYVGQRTGHLKSLQRMLAVSYFCASSPSSSYKFNIDTADVTLRVEDITDEFVFQNSLVLNDTEQLLLYMGVFLKEDTPIEYRFNTLQYQSWYACLKAARDLLELQKKWSWV